MALIIDEEARAALTRRRQRGRDAAIMVRVAAVPARGCTCQIVATWASQRDRQRAAAAQRVDDVTIHLGPRMARYARWHDVTISAWRLGPLTRLAVADEPLVLLELLEWEQLHPGLTAPSRLAS